jgi:hypothetical protein
MTSPKRSLFRGEPPDGCSVAYRHLFAPSHRRAAIARSQSEALWDDFHDLADDAFINRFPFEFHQRWFEMYLGAALRTAGLEVSAPKPGPDLRVLVGSRPIYIEAIAPQPGHPRNPDSVKEPVYWDADGSPMPARVPHDQITLRLAYAFQAKADKFDRYRRDGRVGKEDCCIVAINLREIPHAWADAEEFWFRALYGVGNRFVAIDRAGGATMAGREHRTTLKNTQGVEFDVSPLLRPEHADICGVLGSSADVANVPTPRGDDFALLPHGAPRSPYPSGFIRRGSEVLLRAADDGARWIVEHIDHGAHASRGPERITVEVDGDRIEAEWAVQGRMLSVRVGGRGYGQNLASGQDPETAACEIAAEIVRIVYR